MDDPLKGFDLTVANDPIEVKDLRSEVFSPAISVSDGRESEDTDSGEGRD
jgi:hypothetical protein